MSNYRTDSPEYASPVIAAFRRTWNDGLPDNERQRLATYIGRIAGSCGTDEQETIRSWMALDWLVRTNLPAWLHLAGLDEHADALTRLDPITDAQTLNAAMPAITAASDAAGDTAWTAARAAVRATAGDAARAARAAAGDAAGDAARVAARKARDAASDAARVAARDAVWTARAAAKATAWTAGDTAKDALAPTRDELIESAHDLLDRMLRVTGR